MLAIGKGRGSRTIGRLTVGRLAYALTLSLFWTTGCGGVTTSDIDSARTQVSTASCNYYKMCNQIGPKPDTYDTYADCLSGVMGQWTTAWPTSTCQGHVSQSELTICLDAIGATTDCSGLSALIALSKCSSNTVCSAGVTPDASAD
jgi:hypothetical protein